MKIPNVSKPNPIFRILVVDDNRNGLIARRKVLEEQGHEVVSFTSPEEALAAFSGDSFDLVVTDYRMPQMNGVELIVKIRESRPDVPIILISSVANVLGLDEESTGANAVIPKSANEVDHLVRAVTRLLSKNAAKKPVRSQAAKRAQKTKNL